MKAKTFNDILKKYKFNTNLLMVDGKEQTVYTTHKVIRQKDMKIVREYISNASR